MVQDFIDIVGDWIQGMIGWLGSVFSGVTQLFYDDGFTFLGILMLFGLAVGLIYFGIGFIVRLIKK